MELELARLGPRLLLEPSLSHESCHCSVPLVHLSQSCAQQQRASASLFALRLALYQHFNGARCRREPRDKL